MTALARDLFAAPPSPKPLRDHQVLALDMLRRSIASGHRRPVIQLPTGAGKTRLAAEIVKGALAKGNEVAFTVPAISLIDQTVRSFADEGIHEVGVMQANHVRTDWRQPVQIISVQSLARREKPNAKVVLVDECHMQFQAVRDWMARDRDRIFIGLSATPWSRGMGDDWDDLLVPVTMQELIDRGLLSPFRVFGPGSPDLSKVATVGGDYHEGQLAAVMSDSRLVGDVADTWLKHGAGLPTLVFAVNRAHAKALVEQFAERGVAMGYCDAHVDLIERGLLFARMQRGELSGIVNVGTLTTGVDADVRCIVLARPTKSEALFVQMIGRGLRTAEGKDECLILDHTGNHDDRFGYVTEIHHDALLCGKDRHQTRAERGEPLPKPCPSCKELKPPKVHACPACGFKPERKSGIEHEEGELVEIKRKADRFTKEQKQEFWSMALAVDQERNKGGRLAKALYRGKFGVWPMGLAHRPIKPTPEFMSYVRSRQIAYAKRKAA